MDLCGFFKRRVIVKFHQPWIFGMCTFQPFASNNSLHLSLPNSLYGKASIKGAQPPAFPKIDGHTLGHCIHITLALEFPVWSFCQTVPPKAGKGRAHTPYFRCFSCVVEGGSTSLWHHLMPSRVAYGDEGNAILVQPAWDISDRLLIASFASSCLRGHIWGDTSLHSTKSWTFELLLSLLALFAHYTAPWIDFRLQIAISIDTLHEAATWGHNFSATCDLRDAADIVQDEKHVLFHYQYKQSTQP